MTEQLINPITNERVDEVISEKEAKERGYMTLQNRLRYLEDDSEFFEYYIIDGKKIIVKLEKPYLNYKKPTQVNHERVLQEVEQKKETNNPPLRAISSTSCTVGESGCESCSG